jgi:hypothetical protein
MALDILSISSILLRSSPSRRPLRSNRLSYIRLYVPLLLPELFQSHYSRYLQLKWFYHLYCLKLFLLYKILFFCLLAHPKSYIGELASHYPFTMSVLNPNIRLFLPPYREDSLNLRI